MTQSSLDGYGVVAELAHRHTCPSDCPACAAALLELEEAVDRDTIDGWQDFVTGGSAQRIADHARRSGNKHLPTLSESELIQWLLEEALFYRAELEDTLAQVREQEQLQSQEAVDGSLKRREQVLALQKTAG